MFKTEPDLTIMALKDDASSINFSTTSAPEHSRGVSNLPEVHVAVRRPPHVTMLGLRGFPNVQGGVEKHAEKLACALSELGCEVEAIVRSGWVAKRQETWRNIKFSRIWAPHINGLEAFVHTFLGVMRAACTRPDILHIHAIGPSFFTPLARVLGLRVVVTYHSLNYEHKKWGLFARAILRLGEWAGMTFANGRIAVSESLAEQMSRNYHVNVRSIPNGIDRPAIVRSTQTLQAFGLAEKRYVLTVARIDEAKRQLDLIAAYARIRAPKFKLALAGDADYSGRYACAVSEMARSTPGVVLLGYQTAEALAELYTHASAFALPSAHEGQPIAVLEAASYGLPLILSDITAHREMSPPGARYFAVGDVAMLQRHLAAIFSEAADKHAAVDCNQLIASHDWRRIAQRTLAIYVDVLAGTKSAKIAASEPTMKTKQF